MKLYLDEKLRVPVVGALSFSVGIGIGYFVCNRRWSKVAEEAVEVIEETVGYVETAGQLAADFARAAEEQQPPQEEPITFTKFPHIFGTSGQTDAKPVVIRDLGIADLVPDAPIDDPQGENDFEPARLVDPDVDWNQEEEEQGRSPDAPYVIHREEYYAGSSGFNQTCLEYFASDSMLCDENRVPIYNAEKVIGKLEFGRGSGDSDVVYIRNEALKAEYEVTRNRGSYQTEVLGVDYEEGMEERDLKHSNPVPKFRMD